MIDLRFLDLQHGALTPVPGPTFTDASPAGGMTAGAASHAPSPPTVRAAPGGGVAGNPFARRGTAEQPENSPGNAPAPAAPPAAAAKRKAVAGNPFARRGKTARHVD
jgi:hypothetical protein